MEEMKMGCCKTKCKKNEGLSEEHHKILTAMAGQNDPCGCKDIAEASGMASPSVSCKLKSLKSKGFVDSPARCKYAITKAGKTALAAS